MSSGCISQANAAARRLNAGDYILNDRPLLSGALGRLNGDKWAIGANPAFSPRIKFREWLSLVGSSLHRAGFFLSPSWQGGLAQ